MCGYPVVGNVSTWIDQVKMTYTMLGDNRVLVSVQALRGFAFLLIFLWHLNILHLGSAGVSIFFVLSGFLLTLRYKEDYPQSRIRDSLKFTYDHIKKLYLLYVITSIACLPFLIPKRHGDWLRILKRILVNLILIQTWFTKIDIRYALNNPSWYLSAMVFIYMLFPHIRKGIRSCRTPNSLVFLMLGTALIQLLYSWAIHRLQLSGKIDFSTMRALIYNEPYTRICDFIIGCTLGRLYTYLSGSGKAYRISDIIGLLIFLATCVIRELFYMDKYQWIELVTLALPGTCCIVWFLPATAALSNWYPLFLRLFFSEISAPRRF